MWICRMIISQMWSYKKQWDKMTHVHFLWKDKISLYAMTQMMEAKQLCLHFFSMRQSSPKKSREKPYICYNYWARRGDFKLLTLALPSVFINAWINSLWVILGETARTWQGISKPRNTKPSSLLQCANICFIWLRTHQEIRDKLIHCTKTH